MSETKKENELFVQKGRTLEFDRDAVAMEIKKYRLRHSLTQQALGEKWGLSRYVILRAEGGKIVSWESMYRIFSYLTRSLREEGEV